MTINRHKNSDYKNVIALFAIKVEKFTTEERANILKQRLLDSPKSSDIFDLCKELNFTIDESNKINELWKGMFDSWVKLFKSVGVDVLKR